MLSSTIFFQQPVSGWMLVAKNYSFQFNLGSRELHIDTLIYTRQNSSLGITQKRSTEVNATDK